VGKNKLLTRYQNSSDRELTNLVNESRRLIPELKYGFIHGDFRRRNIFITEHDKVKVVDWEFAGYNFVIGIWRFSLEI